MRPYSFKRLLMSMVLSIFWITLDARADEASRFLDSVSLYTGQGVNHNLKELPGRILAGTPEWERAYFAALGLGKSNKTLSQHWNRLENTPLENVLQGYEIVLVQHRGLQDNAELGVASTLKSTDLELGPIGVSFGAGVGLSYALGTPTYEDGTLEDPTRRYRMQLLLLFDLEWALHDSPDWSLVTRVHHRSGVYGLIAPSHVGSNFLAAGLRYKF